MLVKNANTSVSSLSEAPDLIFEVAAPDQQLFGRRKLAGMEWDKDDDDDDDGKSPLKEQSSQMLN